MGKYDSVKTMLAALGLATSMAACEKEPALPGNPPPEPRPIETGNPAEPAPGTTTEATGEAVPTKNDPTEQGVANVPGQPNPDGHDHGVGNTPDTPGTEMHEHAEGEHAHGEAGETAMTEASAVAAPTKMANTMRTRMVAPNPHPTRTANPVPVVPPSE